jgi:hypothetical protein
LSALLDPRYKRLKYVEKEDMKNKAKQKLVEMVQMCLNKVADSPPPSKKKKFSPVPMSLMDSSSSDDDEAPLASTCSSFHALHEVEKYLREPKCDKSTNPLEWWKINEAKFPTLAQVAREILCIPSTSTASERVFSTAGNIATTKRSLLKPELIDSLIFLAHNKW